MQKLFPIGGHVELNETPWQATAREMKEESGYLMSQIKVLQPKERIEYLSDVIAHPMPVVVSDQDVSTGHFHTDLAYAFVVEGEPKSKIDNGESTDLRWLTKFELDSLTDRDIFINTREIYDFIFKTCLAEWELVSPHKYKI